jgi:hypothetical protein
MNINIKPTPWLWLWLWLLVVRLDVGSGVGRGVGKGMGIGIGIGIGIGAVYGYEHHGQESLVGEGKSAEQDTIEELERKWGQEVRRPLFWSLFILFYSAFAFVFGPLVFSVLEVFVCACFLRLAALFSL